MGTHRRSKRHRCSHCQHDRNRKTRIVWTTSIAATLLDKSVVVAAINAAALMGQLYITHKGT